MSETSIPLDIMRSKFTLLLPITTLIFCTSFPAVRGFLFEKFEQSDCAHSPADILFLLDMSDGVTAQDFEKEKSFVIDFISHVDVRNQEYQVAVSSYASRYIDIAYFNSVVDNGQLLEKVRSSTFNPGHRHLDYALSHVGGNFYHQRGARSYAAKIAFLITAGPGGNRYQDRVEHYASYIPSHYNITLFVIAVTPNAHIPEVAIVARDQKHLFMVDNFSELSSISDELLNTLCQDVIHGRSCFDTSSHCYRYSCSNSYYNYRCPRYCGLCTDRSTAAPTIAQFTTKEQISQATTQPQSVQSSSVTRVTPMSSTAKQKASTVQTKITMSTKLSTLSVHLTTSTPTLSAKVKCQGSDIMCMDDPMAQCQQKQAMFGICGTSSSLVIENCPVLCGQCLQYCRLKESKNDNGTSLATNPTTSDRNWVTVVKT